MLKRKFNTFIFS